MEKLLLVIKQSIEPSIAVTLTTSFHMVLVVSFASSVIVGKHVIQKVMSKTEEKFLFLIPFTKDQKTLITSSRSSSAMLSVFGTLKTSKNGFSSLSTSKKKGRNSSFLDLN